MASLTSSSMHTPEGKRETKRRKKEKKERERGFVNL
jgi:hypothetical protein